MLTDCEIARLARGTVKRSVDYWISLSEKVGMERLVHECMPDGQKTKYCRSA